MNNSTNETLPASSGGLNLGLVTDYLDYIARIVSLLIHLVYFLFLINFISMRTTYCYQCHYRLKNFSECNRTHTGKAETAALVHQKLPQLFQSHLICAGNDLGTQGSCSGDSGGPLMKINREMKRCKGLILINDVDDK